MPIVPDLDDPDLGCLTRLIDNPLTGLLYRRRFQMVLDLCPARPGRVLEIGCGAGFLAYCLAPRVRRYVATDLHDQTHKVQQAMVEMGLDNIECRQADARALTGLPETAFDLVVSVSCLEHIPDATAVQRQVARVLVPGGSAVYGLPIKNLLTRTCFAILGYDDSQIHPTTHSDVIAAARQAGLRLRRQRDFPPRLGETAGLYWTGRFEKAASPRCPAPR